MNAKMIAALAHDLEVIDPNVKTCYLMNEGVGEVCKDYSQYGNNGILKNGAKWTLVSKGGNGIEFDGANDYVEDAEGRHIIREGTSGIWSKVIIGDKTKIVGSGTVFLFQNDLNKKLTGQFIPDFADYCTNLATFHCYANSFSGTLPSFAACTNLATFYCYANSFSGTLPSFAACTNLATFYCYANAFSGYEAGGFATQVSLATLDMRTNAITAAADINAILADLVTSTGIGGRVGCTVQLEGGTNAAPTGQGITDKATLNAIEGWTVTTN